MRTRLLFCLSVALLAVAPMFGERIYLIGDATVGGWSLDDAALMVPSSDGVFEWVGELKDGSLKFVSHKDWVPSYGPATNGAPLALGTAGLTCRTSYDDADNAFAVTAGRYALTITLSDANAVLTVSDGAGLPDKGYTSYYPETIYAIGSATTAGWTTDDAIAMEETAVNSGVYTASLSLQSGELKFLNQKDWGDGYGASVSNDPINGAGTYTLAAHDDDDKKFAVTLASTTVFDATVNLVDGSLVLKESDEEPVVVYPSHLYIIGPAVGGWSWDDNAQEMTTLEEGIYSWSGVLVADEMKFFVAKDFGATAYGATAAGIVMSTVGEYDMVKIDAEDNKFIAPADNVTLTVNLKQMKLTSSKSVTSISTPIMPDSRFEVYNIAGLLVMKSCGDSNLHTLDAGMYVVKSGSTVQKIVVR